MSTFSENLTTSLLAGAGATALGLIKSTWRWTLDGTAGRSDFWDCPQPRIFVYWHNRDLMLPAFHNIMKCGPLSALSSRHRDGRIVSKMVSYFGITSVIGSSSKGGAAGLLALKKQLDRGVHVALTPDGPKGPLYKAKAGAISLAHVSGKYIYPIGCAAERFWRFGSWDRMFLPKPFSRVVGIVPKPIFVPPDADREALEGLRLELEESLNDATKQADQYFV